MTYVEQLEIRPAGNRTLAHAQNDLAGVNSEIIGLRQRLQESSALLDLPQIWLDSFIVTGLFSNTLREMIDSKLPEEFIVSLEKNVREGICNIAAPNGKKYSEINRTAQESKKSLTGYEVKATQLNLEITKLSKEQNHVVTVADLQRKLLKYPHVNNNSIKLADSLKLEFVLENIMMTPTSKNISWLVGDNRTLRLPKSKVVVDFANSNIRILPADTEDKGALIYSAGHVTTHPHVLSNYTPCWGDFGGGITECIHDRDILSIVTLVTMFLEQANTGDGAGKQWYKLIPRFIKQYDPNIRNVYSEEGHCKVGYNDMSVATVSFSIDDNGDPVMVSNSRGSQFLALKPASVSVEPTVKKTRKKKTVVTSVATTALTLAESQLISSMINDIIAGRITGDYLVTNGAVGGVNLTRAA